MRKMETEHRSARSTIYDLKSALSQNLKLQLKSNITHNFAWQKVRGHALLAFISVWPVHFDISHSKDHYVYFLTG